MRTGGVSGEQRSVSRSCKPACNGEVFHLFADRSFEHHPRFEKSLSAISDIAFELKLGPLAVDLKAGVVLNAMKVIEKGPACYFKFGKPNGGGSLWDYAATASIFNDLGLPATNLSGRPMDRNRADSTDMNHRGVIYASSEKIAEAVTGMLG